MPKNELGNRARRLASVPAAAAYVPCSPKTLRRRIADGTVPAYRFGRLLRVDLNELDAALRKIPVGGAA